MSHTPGPWNLKKTGVFYKGGISQIEASGKDIICIDASTDDLRLVASAPELLEACNQAMDIILWMSGSADFGPEGQAYGGWKKAQEKITHIHQAIAKAEGREP